MNRREMLAACGVGVASAAVGIGTRPFTPEGLYVVSRGATEIGRADSFEVSTSRLISDHYEPKIKQWLEAKYNH